jgi:hypothetical protein
MRGFREFEDVYQRGAQKYVLCVFRDQRRGAERREDCLHLYFVSVGKKIGRRRTVRKISYFDWISLTIEKSATSLRGTFDESSWARVATTSQKLLSLRGAPSLYANVTSFSAAIPS